jgi:chromosome segregation ATPase
VDGTLTQVVEEMKNATVSHEEALTTTLVKHKEKMELVTEYLKKIKHKFLDVQTKKETWHAKCLNFESEVQLLKEQKQNITQANETQERTLLEKIQGLEEQVQLASAREMEISTQREVKLKQDAKTMKWKALVLGQLAKVILFDQLLKNQGKELYVVLTKAQLPMV